MLRNYGTESMSNLKIIINHETGFGFEYEGHEANCLRGAMENLRLAAIHTARRETIGELQNWLVHTDDCEAPLNPNCTCGLAAKLQELANK